MAQVSGETSKWREHKQMDILSVKKEAKLSASEVNLV